MDEATSALDTETEQSIQTALRVLGEHRTVLLIAHRLSTVQHAHQIIVMEEGELVERGTHEELLRNAKGSYSRLWAMQSRITTEDDTGAVTNATSSSSDSASGQRLEKTR